jgi:hypothetical protein
MLAEDSLLSSISNFQVLDFTDFSDHRPIKCRLKKSMNIDHVQIIEKFTDQPQRYQWDQDISQASYRDAQKNPTIINHCNDVLTATCASADDVKTLNSRLIDVITKVAGSSLELKKRPDPKKRRGWKTAKNKWFDLDCIKSRIDLHKASKKYCKAPLDEEIKKVYYSKRKEQKRLIKQQRQPSTTN